MKTPVICSQYRITGHKQRPVSLGTTGAALLEAADTVVSKPTGANNISIVIERRDETFVKVPLGLGRLLNPLFR